MEKLTNRVISIIAEHLGIEKSKILLTSHFVEDLGADSLDTLELLMAMEEEFEIEITAEEGEKITTVGQAVAYLKNVEIKDRVIPIIAEHLGIEKSKILLTSHFVEDLGTDSLDTVELLMAMEEEFGIEITNEEGEKITTVSEMIEALKNRGC